ncbi:MAG: SPFH domain-containing protein [Polyangiaceae bacterium]|jgi:SPFH domain / Band 7 family|nr:SPFH domain-containing protein [Polyangiaceae bacterium]
MPPRSPALPTLALCAGLLAGCATYDIPQAHKGRLFGRTGFWTLYSGKTGFTGPTLGPGSYFAGIYDDYRTVNCSTTTVQTPLDTLTRDGVHFGFTVVLRFSADCSDRAIERLLGTLTPDSGGTISPAKIFQTYIQPAIGEAAREYVSPLRANELNERQAEVTTGIRRRFLEIIRTRERLAVIVHEMNLVELTFPKEMDSANLDRAVQALLRDKAIAERERVTAEIETTRMRRELAEREAEAVAVRVQKVGEALRRYPEYLQYDLQQKLPDIYREAGQRGNLILAAPNAVVAPGAQPAPPAPTPQR